MPPPGQAALTSSSALATALSSLPTRSSTCPRPEETGYKLAGGEGRRRGQSPGRGIGQKRAPPQFGRLTGTRGKFPGEAVALHAWIHLLIYKLVCSHEAFHSNF